MIAKVFKDARRTRFKVCVIVFIAVLPFVSCGLSATGDPATGSGTSRAAAFDRDWLDSQLQHVPDSVRVRILADPAGFEAAIRAVLSEDSDLLVLVDKANGLPESYEPLDLIEISSLQPVVPVRAAKPGLQIRRLAAPALQAMTQAAAKAGVTLRVVSAYRSFQYQIGTFNNNVKSSGLKEAERVSARAGHSQHQLGLAIDFNELDTSFAATKAGKWLFSHAGEYGFSLSYPNGAEALTGYSWEPWHYRYIGVPACRLQKTFFDDSQQAMMSFLDVRRQSLRERLGMVGATSTSKP